MVVSSRILKLYGQAINPEDDEEFNYDVDALDAQEGVFMFTLKFHINLM